ncbi:MAG: hypothetical protein AAF430_25220 [Myxococcota bacterium]
MGETTRWRGLEGSRAAGFWALWFLSSCAFASAMAEVYNYASIWGGRGDVFFDYFIPIPVATGTLHWPSLLIAGALAAGTVGATARGFRTRLLLLGAVFGVGVAMLGGPDRPIEYLWAIISPRMTRIYSLNHNPLALFVISDAVLAMIFSFTVCRWFVPARVRAGATTPTVPPA